MANITITDPSQPPPESSYTYIFIILCVLAGIPVLVALIANFSRICTATKKALIHIASIRHNLHHMDILIVEAGIPVLFTVAEMIPTQTNTTVHVVTV